MSARTKKNGVSERTTALVGICGGVAAYKAVEVVSRLRKAGLDVHVAMTEAAGQFVTPLTFGAVSGQKVLTSMFPPAASASQDDLFPHLYPATRADLFLVLPATADMLGKLAHGLGGDVVCASALSLSATCRRVFCPAMNVEMWHQPVVQANAAALEKNGWFRIGPNAGSLACGMEGEGRMAEPQEIVTSVLEILNAEQSLAGRKVLIISGPTREHFDPVRFIGNPSTGKMGKALAEEAVAAGADVTFVTGPVPESSLPGGQDIHVHHVISAQQMLDTSRPLYQQADIVVYAAAVADYTPAEFHDKKLPKQDGELTIRLTATPDIAATLNQDKRAGQVVIGFALQTHDGAQKARAKLEKKRLDGIVLNALDALGGDTGTYTYLSGEAVSNDWGKLDKRVCARRILAEAAKLFDARPARAVHPAS
ncbi:MAG TPA: bifunctional phosphopantothenoylcysteine decarboxylase/phosphopantothenate--cysteine ligase CoaBC [Kiritimatiellia bacterium]